VCLTEAGRRMVARLPTKGCPRGICGVGRETGELPASLTIRLGVCESETGVSSRGRTVDGGTSPRARWLQGVRRFPP
jgi:hypothetical protein